MTSATRYENRLRGKVQSADEAILDVQAHIAVRDPQTADWLTDVRERLLALAPEQDDDPAGPQP